MIGIETKENTSSKKIPESRSFYYTEYGIMWENFLKTDQSVKQVLNKYFNANDLEFTKYITVQPEWKENYNTSTDKGSAFLGEEVEKKKIVFDMYTATKKLIIDAKLTSMDAIGLKDIAYSYYFPDHILYFFFFLPVAHTKAADQLFEDKIAQLVEKFNTYLRPAAQKLDKQEVQKKVKYLTRSDIPDFPALTKSLTWLETYIPKPPYICELCEEYKEFPRFQALFDHKKRKHEKVKERCLKCGKEVPFRKLLDHQKQNHDKVRRICELCGKGFSYSYLAAHKKKEHYKIKEQCKICGKKVPYGTLLDHKKRIHEKLKEQCKICGKFFSLSYISTHKKRDHDNIREKCQVCGKELSYGGLSEHIRKQHPNLKI